MSQHMAFRRQPVPNQVAQKYQALTIPSPTRGIVQSENLSFLNPGAAIVQENWVSTLRGVKLRGGTGRWCDLHSLDGTPWENDTDYAVGDVVYDGDSEIFWQCAASHTSSMAPVTLLEDIEANPGWWTPAGASAVPRAPIISMFEYVSSTTQKMFAANLTKIFDVTLHIPALVKSGQTSGNYASAQFANAAGDFLVVVNDAGDPVLRYNGTTWTALTFVTPAAWLNNTAYAAGARANDTADNTNWKAASAHTSAAAGTFAAARTASPALWAPDAASDGAAWITGPGGTPVANGNNLVYVWKYRSRLYFIEKNSMNAWYLPIDAVGGRLLQIPLSGAATKGGKLLFGASWSISAGDGPDNKCVFVTDQGEAIVFTGTNPADAANWRQEGVYQTDEPMGMNAHMLIGGDLLIATSMGIIPLSQAITKTAEQLELAAITRTIKPMWREEVASKRSWPWTMRHWEEFGGVFVTTPGEPLGRRRCLVANAATNAWCKFTNYDATCWSIINHQLYFGTQDGTVMQAEVGGTDQVLGSYDGVSYVAKLAGGWGLFQQQASTTVWRQARASFMAMPGEPFNPQLAGACDFIMVLPTPPPPGPSVGEYDVWDQGLWGPDLGTHFAPAWAGGTHYTVGTVVYDAIDHGYWRVAVDHTTVSGATFAEYREAAPTYYTFLNPQPPPPVPTQAERDRYLQWDQPAPTTRSVRNTMWVSIGVTGYTLSPIVQVTVWQRRRPSVELISIDAAFERGGVNV